MAVTNTPIFPQTIINPILQLTNGTGTTVTAVFAGGTNGTKIESIIVTSTDTSARDLTFYLTVSATNYALTTITIPITAGTVNNVPSVNILGSVQMPGLARDSNGNPYIYIASGTTLSANAVTTITSAKVINIICQGGNF